MSKTTMALLGQPVVAALSVTLLFLLCLQVANFKPRSILVSDDDEEPPREFSYDVEDEDGPNKWGLVWPLCSTGAAQSPIDINSKSSVYDSKLKNVTFTFDPNPRPQQPMATLDEMVVSLDFYAAQIKFDGRDYSLEQVEFRTKSGHQIDSKEYGIEMDLVFRSRAQRQESQSRVLIFGVLFARGMRPDEFLSGLQQKFKPYLLWKVGETVPAAGQKEFETFLTRVTKGGLQYYTYKGSLQEPACNEGVTWIIAKTPFTATLAQINTFLALTGENHRPTQPLNGRIVSRNWK